MNIQPYLYFGGRTEEAIGFYTSAIGAELLFKMRFNESPEPCPPGMLPPNWGEKIMHATLRIGTSQVMASDGMCQENGKFQGVTLSLTVATDAEADRAFAALSAGGKVDMPLNKTFFSDRFGMLHDRFGVSWMVLVEPKENRK